MLKSFSFPGVSVGQGCVLLLAPSCNGKDPCCSHPYQSQPLCSGSLSSFQLEQEYWYMCLRWQDNIPGFCCAVSWPLSHPCAQAPPQPLQPCTPHFSLSANSSFNCYSPQELHSLLDGPSSLLLSRFLPSLSRIITFGDHERHFSSSCLATVGLFQFILTLLGLVWMLSPWFHSSHSLLFWRTLVLFPYFCCSALVPHSFAPGLVWWPSREFSQTSAAPPVPLEQEHSWDRTPEKSSEMFSKTWPNTSPWACSWLKSVTVRLKWC